MKESPDRKAISVESLVAQVADEFVERLERGEKPEIEEYARRHPQLDTVIRQVLSSLRLIRLSGQASVGTNVVSVSECQQSGCLGDFRLVHEIGRGGMG